jgi:hypothetical protein
MTVVDKLRDSDLKRVMAVLPTGDTAILVHKVEGVPAATLTLAQLAKLLAARGWY